MYFLSINVKYMIELLSLSIPYIYCYLFSIYNNKYLYLFPISCMILIKIIKDCLNRSSLGFDIPKPRERMTKMTDDNVVYTDVSMEELLLYVYDVEEYIKSIGL